MGGLGRAAERRITVDRAGIPGENLAVDLFRISSKGREG